MTENKFFYVVIFDIKDSGPNAAVYDTREAAINRAQFVAKGMREQTPDKFDVYREDDLDEWMFYIQLSSNGDNIRVVKRLLNGGV